jgi:prepilin-type N-terminal cleavage/methylation domain-containing protein
MVSPNGEIIKLRKSPFTLIELLVVVAIILVIMGISLGAFSMARTKARQTVCSSNLKQLGIAVHLYANDYSDHLPVSERLAIHEELEPYVKEPELYHCLADNEEDGLFATDGTSYEWNVFVNGKLIDRSNFKILDVDLWLPLLYDGDYYHGKTKNQLYNDGSIQVYENVEELEEG